MRSIRVLTAALFASLAAGASPAQPADAKAGSGARTLALFIGIGLLGAAASGIIAHMLGGSAAVSDAPVAGVADKPARPSPIRPGVTADVIANLFPPDAAEGVANAAHHA